MTYQLQRAYSPVFASKRLPSSFVFSLSFKMREKKELDFTKWPQRQLWERCPMLPHMRRELLAQTLFHFYRRLRGSYHFMGACCPSKAYGQVLLTWFVLHPIKSLPIRLSC